jgi:hypothetical protein
MVKLVSATMRILTMMLTRVELFLGCGSALLVPTLAAWTFSDVPV